MTRSLAILGGANDQTFLIERAKALGFWTIVFDRDLSVPGREMADEFVCHSCRDVDLICKILNGRDIAGVMTLGSDIPQVVSAVADRLKLPGPSAETARLCTNKLEMKEALRVAGIPVPDLVEIKELWDLLRCMDIWKYVVIKPIDNSGSRGVFVVDGNTQYENPFGRTSCLGLYDRSKGASPSGRVMAEKKLEGLGVSIEILIWDQRAQCVAFADRNYDRRDLLPQIMENGGQIPTVLSLEAQEELIETAEEAGRVLGITRGVCKADMLWTAEGPVVIEIAARLGGSEMCGVLAPLSNGVNYIDQAIRMATDQEPEWNRLYAQPTHVAARYFWPDYGVLEGIDGLEDLKAQPWCKRVEIYVKPGDTILPPKTHGERVGRFFVVADSHKELRARIQEAYSLVQFRVGQLAYRSHE